MSGTKKPKEGEVILVPQGLPYFVRKRPETKKGMRKAAMKKKRLGSKLEPTEYEGEEVFIAPEDEAEIEEWEREMAASEEGAGEVEEGEGGGEEGEWEEGEGGIGFGEEEEKEEGYEEEEETEGGEEEESEVKGAKYETGEELVYAKEPIPGGQKAYAAKFGINLPEYVMKLVPKRVRRRIYETEMRYPGYQYMRIGADGELLPLAKEGPRPIKYLDEDMSPRRKPKKVYSPEKKPSPVQNPYDARYPFGVYVSFSDIPEGAGTLQGIVMAYTDKGVEVSVKGRIHFVEYTNASLKVLPKPARRKEKSPIKDVKVEDVYAMEEIPDIFREMIVESYIDLLKTVREPFKPSKKMAVVEWKMLEQQPLNWEAYYAGEFEKWTFARYHEQIKDELDQEEIEQEAQKLVGYESSIEGLLRQVTDLLPNEELTYTTDINDVLKALRASPSLTVFQAQLIRVLEKEITSGAGGKQEFVSTYVSTKIPKGEMAPSATYYRQPGKPPILRTSPPQIRAPKLVETKPVSGKNLAVILSNAVDSYLLTYPPDLKRAIDVITRVAVRKRFEEYEPTPEDKAEFESEHLEILERLHAGAEEKYASEKKKAAEMKEYEKEHAAALARYDEKLVDEVRGYEQIVYESSGGTVLSYLSTVLFPYIFLDSPISSHAKFFRSKLANGDFEFDALAGANLAHYLPELAMNQKLTDSQWTKATNVLGVLLKNQVDALIDLYITIHNPTSRRDHVNLRQVSFGLSEDLIMYLKDPSDICFAETETGKRPVVKDGKYVYVPGTRDYMMEKIPPGEMTICYSNGKFTCHDVRSVLRSIAQDEEPMNPYTGQPYPAAFVAKMKTRYADRLGDQDLWQEPEEPEEPEFEPLPVKPKPKKRTPTTLVVKKELPEKKERVRHKPPKKPQGQIRKIGLVGDQWEILTLFGTSFDVWVKDAKGQPTEKPKSFEFTDDVEDDDVNVIVFGFDASQSETIDELDVNAVKEGALIYVIGINADGIKGLDRTKLTRKVKKALGDEVVNQVFYLDGSDEEELIAGLTDVAIDVEALKVLGS